MGAGGLLGMRQHMYAAGHAQRHDSAGVFKRKKTNKVFLLLARTPHPDGLAKKRPRHPTSPSRGEVKNRFTDN